MANPKALTGQTDFSGGEIDVSAKRSDSNPLVKTGARQASNWRILNTKKLQNRSGRRALARLSGAGIGRVEQVVMSPGNVFSIAFQASRVSVLNSNGAVVFTLAGRLWVGGNLNQIVWAVSGLSIYITFPGTRPLVLSWDGLLTWTSANYAEQVTSGGAKRTAFYRISAKGITMHPAGCTGVQNVVFSQSICTPAMVGTYFRYINRQMLVNSYIDPATINVTIIEPLPGSQTMPTPVDPRNIFNLGDVVQGTISGAQGYIVTLTVATIGVQLLNPQVSVQAGNIPPQYANLPAATLAALGLTGPTTVAGFVATDVVVGPGGSTTLTGAPAFGFVANAVPFWDEEVMNDFRGYPQSVFSDQGRLGFCNFPAVPNGISWAAIGAPTDLFVGASPNSAMFELVPDNSQALYVIPGMNGSEFVFCDRAIYDIPINVTNPLRPGSVAFEKISQHGCSPNVQPRRAEQSIIYVKAGGAQIGAVQAPGATQRPYTVDNISEMRTHLLNSPLAIAIPGGSTQFEESYIYVLNLDGTLAVGKYAMRNGLIDVGSEGRPNVGWVPWSGAGTVQWVAALNSDVIFTTLYPQAIGPIVESLDDTRYLDGSVYVNSMPAALVAPVGQGPLWWMPNGTVTLIDLVTRFMGTYQIDGSGFIVPQSIPSENLLSPLLIAGQPWNAAFEPFVPPAQQGQDVGQRTKKRRIARAEFYVSSSTGFRVDSLNTEQSGINLPAIGSVKRSRRIDTWNMDEDPTQPAPLRERAYGFKPLGRAHDPRIVLVKDTPGPLIIEEVVLGVSV